MKATHDPIIERIRAARMKLSAKCGHDLHQVAAMGRQSYDKWISRQQELRKTARTAGSEK